MKKLLLLLLSLIAISFTACHKSIPNYPVNAGLLKNFYYKPGSYWIYRDSLSGRIDSFILREERIDTKVPGNGETDDEILMGILEYNTDNVYAPDSTVWSWQLVKNQILILYQGFLSKYGSINFYPLIYYPFENENINIEILTGISGSDTITMLTSTNIYGQTYNDVATIHYNIDVNQTDSINDIFI